MLVCVEREVLKRSGYAARLSCHRSIIVQKKIPLMGAHRVIPPAGRALVKVAS